MVLLYKLEKLRNELLKWFKNYLHDKKSYVVINGANQTLAILRLKVRQESIRGFLVFLIIILMIW